MLNILKTKNYPNYGKNQEKGFTLVELLAVIMIITALAAIAMPSILNQANKAKQSEAKQHIGAICRSQYVFYTENARFANTIGSLGIGLSNQSQNYIYSIVKNDTFVTHIAQSQQIDLRSYACVVGTIGTTINNDLALESMFCEANTPGNNLVIPDNVFNCPNNFSPIKK